jgi:hypothetical protein
MRGGQQTNKNWPRMNTDETRIKTGARIASFPIRVPSVFNPWLKPKGSMNKLKTLILLLTAALPSYAQVTNVVTTNVTHTATNRAPATAAEFQVPITLSSLRFVVGSEYVMGANLAADKLLLDVPGSTRKLWSYTLEPSAWYVVETKVTTTGGILETKRFQPITGVTDLSPNLPRNQYSGEFDTFKLFLVPPPPDPPR